jgi:hypothetical protein
MTTAVRTREQILQHYADFFGDEIMAQADQRMLDKIVSDGIAEDQITA